MSSKPPPVWWKRVLRTLGLTLAVLVTLSIVLILFFENALIYFPTKGGVKWCPGEDVTLTTADGVKLHGWYGTSPQAKLTILWFHGNAGNLEDRRSMFRELRALPANCLVIDYRGFGNSEGSPNEKGLYLDARAAWDWLCTKTTPDKIVILGKSIGGGPACELATQVKPAGLIVQSAFTKAPDLASRVMPWFPIARFIMRTRFDNLSKVAKITCPKLFIHSRDDEVIPFAMGERLFAAAAEPKEQAWFEGAGHNELWIVKSDSYYSRLKQFLDGVSK